MGKVYRTIDLLKRSYDGEKFKNKFRDIRTEEIIEQGSQKLNKEQFFIIGTDGTVNNIFNTVDKCCDFIGSIHTLLIQEWEEVQEPVTFMEAVESGKKIRVEHPRLCITSEYHFPCDLLYGLSVHHTDSIFRDIILNGKWYIKEAD